MNPPSGLLRFRDRPSRFFSSWPVCWPRRRCARPGSSRSILRGFAGGTSLERGVPAHLRPQGWQVLGGVPFQLEGAVQLFGEGAQQNGETNRLAVTGVPVNRAFARRHLLGGAAFESSPGAAVAHVRLHYADGAPDDLPIVQGAHVRSCWGPRHQAEPAFTDANTRVVWRAPHAAAAEADKHLRVMRSELVNPRPDQPVTSLDLVSARPRAGRRSHRARRDDQRDAAGRGERPHRRRHGAGQRGPGRLEPSSRRGTVTFTDTEGRFTLAALSDDRSYRLLAQMAGFARAVWQGADPRGGPIEFRRRPQDWGSTPASRLGPDLTLRLEPWAALTGVLVDTNGTVSVGEALTLTLPDSYNRGEPYLNFSPWPRTDAQGRFTFPRVPLGDYQLVRLQPPGRTAGWSHQPQRPVTVQPGITNNLGNVLKDQPPKPGPLGELRRSLGL